MANSTPRFAYAAGDAVDVVAKDEMSFENIVNANIIATASSAKPKIDRRENVLIFQSALISDDVLAAVS